MVARQLEEVFFCVGEQFALELEEILFVAPRDEHVGGIGRPQLLADMLDLVEIVGADDRLEPKLGVLAQLRPHELLGMQDLIELVDD